MQRVHGQLTPHGLQTYFPPETPASRVERVLSAALQGYYQEHEREKASARLFLEMQLEINREKLEASILHASSVENQLQESENEVQELRDAMGVLREGVRGQQMRADRLEEELLAMKNWSHVQQEHVTGMERRLEEGREDIKQLDDAATELSNGVGVEYNRANSLAGQLVECQGRLEDLLNVKSRLLSQLDVVEKRAIKAEEAMANNSAYIGSLEDEVAALRKDGPQYDRQPSMLNHQLGIFEAHSLAGEATADTTKAGTTPNEVLRSSAEADVRQLIKDLEAHKERCEVLSKENAQLVQENRDEHTKLLEFQETALTQNTKYLHLCGAHKMMKHKHQKLVKQLARVDGSSQEHSLERSRSSSTQTNEQSLLCHDAYSSPFANKRAAESVPGGSQQSVHKRQCGQSASSPDVTTPSV